MSIRTAAEVAVEVDEGYSELERQIREKIANIEDENPVFTTDIDPEELWNQWLYSLPESRRQHYRCHCCRQFIQKYGGLVRINLDGSSTPLLWFFINGDSCPEMFVEGHNRLYSLVSKAKVTGVFLWSDKEKVWGTPECGGWTHLSGTTQCKCFHSLIQTPQQAMAEKVQDFGILCRSLADYPLAAVEQAVRVLEAGAVYRSEKALGVAQWALELHRRIEHLKGEQRRNLIWWYVANAPVGYCHLRTTVISTLLDDIVAGLPFDTISSRWTKKLNPLQYQRPTAAPTDGAIKEAERIFQSMGAARSLERRYATLDDVLAFEWEPKWKEPEQSKGGLFDHLKTTKQTVREIDLPPTLMTMERWRREVLPTALEIEVLVPSKGNFYGLVTATDPDAPAILQWDGIEGERRNPISQYVYHSGSYCSNWSLSSGWCECPAIFLSPSQWQRPQQFRHQSQKVHFVLKGCWDQNSRSAGLGLFLETLRSEFHSVRSVIEAHSKSMRISDPEKGNANGICFQNGSSDPLMVRVRTTNGRATYKIDRWE